MRKRKSSATAVKEPDLLEKDRYHRVVLLIVYGTTNPKHDFPLEWRTYRCMAMKQLAFTDGRLPDKPARAFDARFFPLRPVAKRNGFERRGWR